MTPLSIIQQATAGGVNLALSAAGILKARGSEGAVNLWLAAIKEHKPAIIETLKQLAQPAEDVEEAYNQAEPLPCNDIHDGRRYCGECINLHDRGVCIAAFPGGTISANRGYRPSPGALIRCAGFKQNNIQYRPEGRPPEKTAAKFCATCAHAARPGLGNLHCGGREDLPLAYGKWHPLHKLPADNGINCEKWEEA